MIKPDWVPLSKVMAIIKKSNGSWWWFKNTRAKYIELRIDMRTFHCTLKDRHGDYISLEELEYQYGQD